MTTQMDVYLKKEQIGTLFVLVGLRKGVLGGGGEGESSSKIIRGCLSKDFFWRLLSELCWKTYF